MSISAERVKAVIELRGEIVNFTTYGGGAAASIWAAVAPCGSGDLRTYLDDVELMSVTHPAIKLTLSGDSLIAVSDQFSRDSRAYTVLKVFLHRVGVDVIGITAVAA